MSFIVFYGKSELSGMMTVAFGFVCLFANHVYFLIEIQVRERSEQNWTNLFEMCLRALVYYIFWDGGGVKY